MHHLIKAFRRVETTNDSEFKSQPPGDLVVRRLIQGEKCWRSPTSPKKITNNILILADWTAGGWTREKTTAVINALRVLMTPSLIHLPEAFTVYLWQSGTLVLLNPDNLSSLYSLRVRHDVDGDNTVQRITSACFSALGCSKEQICILDYQWVNRLINPESVSSESTHRARLTISDLMHIAQPYLAAIRVLDSLKTPINELAIDVLNNVSLIQQLEFLKRAHPHLSLVRSPFYRAEISARLLELLFTNEQIEYFGAPLVLEDFAPLRVLKLVSDGFHVSRLKILFKQIERLNKLDFLSTGALAHNESSAPGELLFFPNLESLNLKNETITTAHFAGLLNAAKLLKELSLDLCIIDEGSLELSAMILEELSLIRTKMPHRVYNDLLRASSLNVQRIQIHHSNNLQEPFALEGIHFPELEELGLWSCDISSENLHLLILNTHKLAKINIYHCRQLKAPIKLARFKLEALTVFDLQYCTLNLSDIEDILKASPNLHKLSVQDQDVKDDGFLLDAVHWHQLKELYFNNVTINARNIQTIIAGGAASLKKIYLNVKLNDQELVSFAGINLSQLEEFTFTEQPISARLLSTLLKAAPNLKKLDLANTTIEGDLNLEGVNLEHLHTLNMPSTGNSWKNTRALLQVSPNLKILNLENHTPSDEDLNLDGIRLARLAELRIDGSIINSTSFSAIIRSAPNLVRIHASNCTNLTGALALHGGRLDRLESLSLEKARLPLKALNELLAVSPSLAVLNLGDCKNLSGILILKPGALPCLQSLELSNSTLSAPSLQALMLAAPTLRSLFLMDCSSLDGLLVLGETKFPYLVTLDINGSYLSSASIYNLLSAAAKIQVLDLSDCTIDDDFDFSSLDLSELTSVNLYGTTISLAALEGLLRCAPKLTSLSLGTCATKGMALNTLGIRLEQLKELSLEESGLSQEDVRALAAVAPKIAAEDLLAQLNEHAILHSTPADTLSNLHAVPEDKEYIDANTTPDSGTLHARAIFYPIGDTPEIHVSQYRLKVYTDVHYTETPCSIEHAFYLPKIPDLELVAPSPPSFSDQELEEFYSVYKGVIECTLSQEWYELPSLSAAEVLGELTATPPIPVDINYSPITNLYYIRLTSPLTQKVQIDFTVLVPKKSLASTTPLPDEVKPIIEQFRSFKAEQLTLEEGKEYTGLDYLNALWQQEKGACRHRVIVFYQYMRAYHPTITVRLIWNECHAFVEIFTAGVWHACDLGGYATDLVVEEAPLPYDDTEEVVSEEGTEEIKPIKSGTEAPHERLKPQLATWIKETSTVASTQDYCQKLFAEVGIKKRVLACPSLQALYAFAIKLQAAAELAHRPVFFVHTPNDLACATPYINEEGILMPGPGGRFYTFINSNPNGLVLINFTQFTRDETARYNSLFDPKRTVDGYPLPPQITLIGLIDSSDLGFNQGEDFYSRFDSVSTLPLSPSAWEEGLHALPEEAPSPLKELITIDLFNAPTWREKLLGTFRFSSSADEAGRLYYEEGELVQALRLGATRVELANGLWKDPEFIYFWQAALFLGYIEHQGHRLNLPKGFTLYRHEGYDWRALSAHLSTTTQVPDLVLNAKTLPLFLSRFDINEAQQFIALSGYIEEASTRVPSRTLSAYLHQEFNEDEWALLLSACQHHGMQLMITGAPNIPVPMPLQHKLTPLSTPSQAPNPWSIDNPLTKTLIIQSSDVDTTVAQIKGTHTDYLIIDGSELDCADLLYRIDGALDKDSLRFVFNKTPGVLVNALAAHQKVMIKGAIQQELADELAPLLMQRAADEEGASGHLMLITSTNTLHFTQPFIHKVTAAEKKACLPADDALRSALGAYYDESLSQLICRFNWLLTHPGSRPEQSDAAWIGLRTPAGEIKELSPLNSSTCTQEAAEFTAARLSTVNEVLAREPYVLLSGLSGVGKTTFVQQHFNRSKGHCLFQGKEALGLWATTQTADGLIVLFIDEANLDPSDWSLFEDMYGNQILIYKGQIYPLTAKHKVIFACNPVSYGSERHLASFFARHGNSVWFDPLPTAVLYEDLLKPIFSETALAGYDYLISATILEAYRFLTLRSSTEVLISPRELQMIALMTLSYCRKTLTLTEDKVKAVVAHYTYQIAKPLVPKQYQISFEALFKPQIPLPKHLSALRVKPKDTFFTAHSRQAIQSLLEDLLALRALRRTPSAKPEHQYAGLGGIILEGEPGIGKSEMVAATLAEYGFIEHDPRCVAPPADTEAVFYRIPLSLSFAEKKRLLLEAFDSGALVVMEEINSAPMMEELLNELLMGYYKGKRPKHPGFLIIATQNPGRHQQSCAFSRRVIKEVIPSYTNEEMVQIICNKGLDREYAAHLVQAYQEQRKYAHAHGLSPVPTFRDVIKIADNTISLYKAIASSITYPPPREAEPTLLGRKRKIREIEEDTVGDATPPSSAIAQRSPGSLSIFLAPDTPEPPQAKRPRAEACDHEDDENATSSLFI